MSGDLIDCAIACHLARRFDAAAAHYREALRRRPGDPEALHLSGLLLLDQGNPAAALPLVEAAIAAGPERAAIRNTHGRVLAALGRDAEAEDAYRHGWTLRPDLPETASNLGCLLRDRGDLDGAVAWLERAADAAPPRAAILANLALALADRGDHDAAGARYRQALAIEPDNAAALEGSGRLFLLLGQAAPAAQALRAALRAAPGRAATHTALGVALERLGQLGAAEACFRAALALDPDQADAHRNLGCIALLHNNHAAARAHHDQALARQPADGQALWGRCMAELPLLYQSHAEIPARRAAYRAALARLEHLATDPARRGALAATIGAAQPFFLPYQGENDRDLQARLGTLIAGLVPADPSLHLAGRPAAGERLRLGLVTGFAREHTVWRLMVKGWLAHLDRARLEVALFDTGDQPDQETAAARTLADRYFAGAATARASIVGFRPHALIYPELGMDPTCARLAAERLAPLQCVCWGHPVTTGLPTIDVFLSSAAMEPPEAQTHYRERLVTLPGLGIAPMLQDDAAAPLDRAAFALRPAATVFWCGQALYKYLPLHDDIFARIAQAVPDSQFLFIGFARSAALTARFHDRLGRAFAARNLDPAHHCVVVDAMDQAGFRASVRAADIVLDSILWSGGKSTLDLLAEARPIVTLPGEMMRGRHTAAILRLLGVEETVVASLDDYVATAVRLAGAPALRADLGARIARGRDALLADLTPVRALEAFLDHALR